jgi:hypothetical protein
MRMIMRMPIAARMSNFGIVPKITTVARLGLASEAEKKRRHKSFPVNRLRCDIQLPGGFSRLWHLACFGRKA